MRSRRRLLAAVPAALTALMSTAPAQDVATARAHYARVVAELRTADTAQLTTEQQQARTRVIEWLGEYRERGDFGINTDYPGQHMPYFVDDGGRRCAVAYLLDRSGHGAITDRVAATRNHAWVVDLGADTELLAWLARHGLDRLDAARIQMPSGGIPRPSRPPMISRGATPGELFGITGAIPEPRPARPSGNRPGRGRPATRSPRTSPPRSTPRPTRPAAPRRTPGAARAATPTTPRGIPLSALSGADWQSWWHYQRLHYLEPNRLRFASTRLTGPDQGDDDGTAKLATARAEFVERVLPLLGHPDSAVRSAAAVALGRVAGEAAVEPLRGLLHDPNVGVRHIALLALGATGAPGGVHTLLHVSHRGAAPGSGEQVGDVGRPLAVLALGLAKRAGYDGELAHSIATLIAAEHGEERDEIAIAAMLVHTLAPSPELTTLARRLLVATDEADVVRCRAVETLRIDSSRPTLGQIVRAQHGRDLDVRRSAVMALGASRSDEALPPLQTGFEVENELLTRAFTLLAIGNQGGPRARAFLLREIRTGRKALRSWAALGLGLLARQARYDADVCRALRDGWRRERNRDAKGAYLIALGLARDTDSVALTTQVMYRSHYGEMRAAAAEALALIGGDAARRALRERLREDPCAGTRLVLAEILGLIGHRDDTASIAKELEKSVNPDSRGRLARALGYLATPMSKDALDEMMADSDESAIARAAAIESLGMMLSRTPPMQIAELARDANFTMFPFWLQSALQLTL